MNLEHRGISEDWECFVDLLHEGGSDATNVQLELLRDRDSYGKLKPRYIRRFLLSALKVRPISWSVIAVLMYGAGSFACEGVTH